MIRSSKFILVVALAVASVPVLASAGQRHHGTGHHDGSHHGAKRHGAGHHGGHRMGGHGGGVQFLLDHLDLSDEQQEQARSLVEAQREATEALRQAHRDARREVHEQIHAEVFDEAAIRQASEAAAAAEEDLAVTRGRLFQDLRQILTAEQLGELESLRQRLEEHREHRRSAHRDSEDTED